MSRQLRYYYSSSGEVPKYPREAAAIPPSNEKSKIRPLSHRYPSNTGSATLPDNSILSTSPVTIRIPSLRRQPRNTNYRNTVCFGDLRSLRSSNGDFLYGSPSDILYTSETQGVSVMEKGSKFHAANSKRVPIINSNSYDKPNALKSTHLTEDNTYSDDSESLDLSQIPDYSSIHSKLRSKRSNETVANMASTIKYVAIPREDLTASLILTDDEFLNIINVAYRKIFLSLCC